MECGATWGTTRFMVPRYGRLIRLSQKKMRAREGMALEIRGECFNLLNRAQYGNPNADISAPASFGRITTLVNNGPIGSGTPRQFQIALRLLF